MNKIAVFLISLFFLMSANLHASNENQESKINWLTIEEAEKLALENPKMILVDVYTDWCGWCKRMEANTFSHPDIVNYINENFYPVKLNAEQSEPITYRGQKFVNDNPGGRRSAHGFARFLLQDRMGYPSVVFINDTMTQFANIPGYREPKQFEPILVFFGEGHHLKTSDLEGFINNFKGKIE